MELHRRTTRLIRTSSPNRVLLTINIGTDREEMFEDCQADIERHFGFTVAEFMASSYARQGASTSILGMKPVQRAAFVEDLAASDGEYARCKAIALAGARTSVASLREATVEVAGAEGERLQLVGLLAVDEEELVDARAALAKARTRVPLREGEDDCARHPPDVAIDKLTAERDHLRDDIATSARETKRLMQKQMDARSMNSAAENARRQVRDLEDEITELSETHLPSAEEITAMMSDVEAEILDRQRQNQIDLALSEVTAAEKAKEEAKIRARDHPLADAGPRADAHESISHAREMSKVANLPSVEELAKRLYPASPPATRELLIEKATHEIRTLTAGECPGCNVRIAVKDVLDEKSSSFVNFPFIPELVSISQPTGELASTSGSRRRVEELTDVLCTSQRACEIPPADVKSAILAGRCAEESVQSLEAAIARSTRADVVVQQAQARTDALKKPIGQQQPRSMTVLVRERDRLRDDLSAEKSRMAQLASARRELKHAHTLVESIAAKLGNDGASTDDAIRAEMDELALKEESSHAEIQRIELLMEIQRKRSVVSQIEKKCIRIKKMVDDVDERIAAVQKDVDTYTTAVENFEKMKVLVGTVFTQTTTRIVKSMNVHAAEYLSAFFEDPIVLTLGMNSRAQLVENVWYKGSAYASIDELSGGERQRCELAFLLAANDTIGSGFLLLDECMNSLDSATNTRAFRKLSNLMGSRKLILVVSHEAVTGVFDEVIEV